MEKYCHCVSAGELSAASLRCVNCRLNPNLKPKSLSLCILCMSHDHFNQLGSTTGTQSRKRETVLLLPGLQSQSAGAGHFAWSWSSN